MAKSADEVRTIIEKWFDDTGVSYEDITKSQKPKNPKLEWALLVGKSCFIFMVTGRDDRVTIENPIKFSDKHQQASEKLDKKNFLDFINGINEPPVVAGFSTVYKSEKQRIMELKLSEYIDTEELTRDKLFHIIDRLSYMKAHLIRKIQTILDLESASLTNSQETSNKAMYG